MCRMNERGQNFYEDVFVKTSEACDIFTMSFFFHMQNTNFLVFSFLVRNFYLNIKEMKIWAMKKIEEVRK